jgi:spore germination protein YaaH
VEALARRLARDQVWYAYFHVRHVTADGSLRYHYREEARRLVARVHRAAPSVRVIAWVFAGNNGAGGLPVVDLSNTAVRREMVREARWLVDECGFDGVQWDYEVCRSGDPSLPSLLRETRAALQTRPAGSALERRGAPIISVATAVWGPPAVRRWTWSEAYLGDVAAAADQIAVMCYDTGLYLPRAYVWLVHEQAVRATRAAARRNPRCRVLLGVPTYARGGPAQFHAPSRKNKKPRMALRGGRGRAGGEGMARPPCGIG